MAEGDARPAELASALARIAQGIRAIPRQLDHQLLTVGGTSDDRYFTGISVGEFRRLLADPVPDVANGIVGNKDVLVAAVLDWGAERQPEDPGDAQLMQALWRYSGDRKETCPECDGECGEPCAPCTVDHAVAALQGYIDEWREKRGIRQEPLSSTPPGAS